jgi:hypothetical protein
MKSFFKAYIGKKSNLSYAFGLKTNLDIGVEIGRRYFNPLKDIILFNLEKQSNIIKYAKNQWNIFLEQYNDSSIIPPHMFYPVATKPLMYASDPITPGIYSNGLITIIFEKTIPSNYNFITIDISKRSNCFLTSKNPYKCAKPEIENVNVEFISFNNTIIKTEYIKNLKSRFNIQFGRYHAYNESAEKITFLPIMYETYKFNLENIKKIKGINIRSNSDIIIGRVVATY